MNMANIFTTNTPLFKKQSLGEFFMKPMFLGKDIRDQVTVRTGVKGTELLNHISAPSFITRKKTEPGFTPRGSFKLTTQSVTVSPMAIEFEQNAREFWDSIIQELLASGYKEDDIEKIPESKLWNNIILPMIARAGKQDLIRQMWFADTASSDEDWNGYDGFFKNIRTVVDNNTNLALGTVGRQKQYKVSVGDHGNADDTLHLVLTVDGTAHDLTMSADHDFIYWASLHTAELKALGIDVNVPDADNLYLTGMNYQDFTVELNYTVVSGEPDGEVTLITDDPVAPSLPEDVTDDVLNTLLDNAAPELLELQPVFYLSYSAWRNLFKTWKNLGTDKANIIRWKGLEVPSYEGHPIMIRPDWDRWDKILNPQVPGRVLFTTPRNLIFATDGALDSEMVETWYNQDEQMRRYRVQYKAATAVLHAELIAGANL
jgi:hypothetical protein